LKLNLRGSLLFEGLLPRGVIIHIVPTYKKDASSRKEKINVEYTLGNNHLFLHLGLVEDSK